MNTNDMLNKFVHLLLTVVIGTADKRSRLVSSSDGASGPKLSFCTRSRSVLASFQVGPSDPVTSSSVIACVKINLQTACIHPEVAQSVVFELDRKLVSINH